MAISLALVEKVKESIVGEKPKSANEGEAHGATIALERHEFDPIKEVSEAHKMEESVYLGAKRSPECGLAHVVGEAMSTKKFGKGAVEDARPEFKEIRVSPEEKGRKIAAGP